MRENVEQRPILLLGSGLVLGLTLLTHPANGLFLLVLFAALRGNSARVTLLVGLGVGLLLTPAPLQPVVERQFVSGRGTVVSPLRQGSTGTKFNLELGDRTWEVYGEKIPDLSLGDKISIVGVGLPLREGSEQYLSLHGVSGRLESKGITFLESGPWLWRVAGNWRSSFRGFCRANLPAEAASITNALCFDLTGELSRDTTDRLKETGTIHIVSASGLHVIVIWAAVIWALSKAPIPRGVQIALAAIVLILYAGATGLNPPIVRAVLMCLLGSSAYLFRRERDALSGLGLAAVLYLVWQPRQIYDPGFQLSFVTVGALAMFVHPMDAETNGVRRVVLEGLWLSWVAFAASAPLVAYHFGTVSLSALPANLLLATAASVAIVSAFAAYTLSGLIPVAGVLLLKVVAGPMAGWILWVIENLGGHAWSSVAFPAFSAYWLPIVYGAMLMTWRQRIVQP